MKFKTTMLYLSILLAGLILSDHETLKQVIGGLLIFIAGDIAGRADAEQNNKISDHFRRMTKR